MIANYKFCALAHTLKKKGNKKEGATSHKGFLLHSRPNGISILFIYLSGKVWCMLLHHKVQSILEKSLRSGLFSLIEINWSNFFPWSSLWSNIMHNLRVIWSHNSNNCYLHYFKPLAKSSFYQSDLWHLPVDLRRNLSWYLDGAK